MIAPPYLLQVIVFLMRITSNSYSLFLKNSYLPITGRDRNSYFLIGIITYKINIFQKIQTFNRHNHYIYIYIYIYMSYIQLLSFIRMLHPKLWISLIISLQHSLFMIIKIIVLIVIPIQGTKHALSNEAKKM